MTLNRRKLVAGVVLGGLVGGVSLGSVLRAVKAGPGDPPVIVLPSAKAAAKAGIVLTQATKPQPKLEILPLPQIAPLASSEKSPPPIAPPLLVIPEQPLRPAPAAPTLTAKEPAAPFVRETAPLPRAETIAEKPVAVLPMPTPAIPSPLAPLGESTMLKPALAAAAVSAALAGTVPAEPPKPDSEKSTNYARLDDAKSIQDEIDALRKQLDTLRGDASKATDLKSIRDEIESLKKAVLSLSGSQPKAVDLNPVKSEIEALKKEVAALSGKVVDPVKSSDIKTVKDELTALRKEITALAAKPADAKAMKEEVDALRKDVATLNTFLREALDGKVERGFTHDGIIRKLAKLDESVEALAKKAGADAAKTTAGSSPVPKTAEPLPASRGVVRIVNDYPIPVSIVVNGLTYKLEPRETKDVAVPSGSFKYQLMFAGATDTERAIKENETVTLTIR